MMHVKGDRIARTAKIRVVCDAAVFDPGGRLLLTRRADNGTWIVPGGRMEPGEFVTEACEREVFEETGLIVRVTRLIAVYSNVHHISVYPDNRWQHVELLFAAERIGGELRTSDETTAVGFFSTEEAANLEMLDHERERVIDAFAGGLLTLIK